MSKITIYRVSTDHEWLKKKYSSLFDALVHIEAETANAVLLVNVLWESNPQNDVDYSLNRFADMFYPGVHKAWIAKCLIKISVYDAEKAK
ncbi:MAG: hypothetical protein LBF00_00345 [Mycoplasmataceae bacterium]|nr:hypothetical protein [Mycoplasmataceae bacterium]